MGFELLWLRLLMAAPAAWPTQPGKVSVLWLTCSYVLLTAGGPVYGTGLELFRGGTKI